MSSSHRSVACVVVVVVVAFLMVAVVRAVALVDIVVLPSCCHVAVVPGGHMSHAGIKKGKKLCIDVPPLSPDDYDVRLKFGEKIIHGALPSRPCGGRNCAHVNRCGQHSVCVQARIGLPRRSCIAAEDLVVQALGKQALC